MEKIEDLFKAEYQVDLDKVLPPELVNPRTGDHLYMIGAAYYKRHADTKRIRFHRPEIFLTTIALIFTRSLMVIFWPKKYAYLLFWIGDISNMIKLNLNFNLLLITFDYIIYSVHFLHYQVNFRYRKLNIVPNNIPFDLVAGLITPRQAGFYDKRKVVVYAKFVKSSLSFCHYLTRYFMNVYVALAFYMVYWLNINQTQPVTLLVSLMHTAVWGLKSHIFFTYLFYHMLYFYIICFYLRLKINTIHTSIEKLQTRKHENTNLRIFQLISSLKKIYEEIVQFNVSFWSRFIFSIWSGFSVNISTFLYTTIYGNFDIIVRMICWLVLILEICSVTTLCLIASSVNKKARTLYFSLNSNNQRLRNIKLRMKIKLTTWIELWSSKLIGFTCWRLFPLNYFTFYEMVAVVATLYLKLIEINR